MAGWMAAKSLPSFTGPIRCHFTARGSVRSKWTRQPWSSVLLGHRRLPSASCTGGFFVGPRNPSGWRRGFDQLLPPSAEVMTMPHQRLGLGPTL